MAQPSACPSNNNVHISLLLFAFCNVLVTTPVSLAYVWPLAFALTREGPWSLLAALPAPVQHRWMAKRFSQDVC